MDFHVRLAVLCLWMPGVAAAATCPVTTTSDSGAGSLRAAIDCANADPDVSAVTITAGGTVSLASPLPDVTTAMRIAGPAAADYIVDGSAVGGLGLKVLADHVVVRDTTWTGFAIALWVEDADDVALGRNTLVGNTQSGIFLFGQVEDPLIVGNRVEGTGQEGVVIRATGTGGLFVYNTVVDGGSDGVIIQGRAGMSLLYNEISGNDGHGIHANGGVSNLRIRGNEIGTDLAFTDRGNTGDGIHITNASVDFDILDNVIAYNGGSGVAAVPSGPVGGHIIQGNFVGGDGAGNGAHGIHLSHTASDCLVGGPGPGEANEVVGNQLDGIRLDAAADRNTFSRNLIRGQGGRSIHLGDGTTGNEQVLPPRIEDATDGLLTVTTAQADVQVEVFLADPDGAEAWLYLGDATQVGPQEWTYQAPSWLDHFVVVATDASGNSGGFGRDVALDLTVTHTGDTGPGSLRAALEFAAASTSPSEILWDLPALAASHDGSGPAAVHVIAVPSALPDVVAPLDLDTCDVGGGVVLDGEQNVVNGLWYRSSAAGSTLRCLNFRGLQGTGVVSQAADMIFDRVTVHDSITGLSLQAQRPVLVGVDISDNQSGVLTNGADGIDVSDSLFEGNGVDGLHLFQLTGATVHGNEFVDNGKEGVTSTHANDLEIIGNRASGNGCHGIFLYKAAGVNLIQANRVGIDADLTGAQPNGANHDECHGIRVDFSGGMTLIGGDRANDGNEVVANEHDGIHVVRTLGVEIHGNDIGVTRSGVSMGNGDDGIEMSVSTSGGRIGTWGTPGDGNHIGANRGHGVHLSHHASGGYFVWANRIGTDGVSVAFGNFGDGVHTETDSDRIGVVSDGNVIGLNGGAGIYLGQYTDGTIVEANRVGLGTAGLALPNGGAGIELEGLRALVNDNIVENNLGTGVLVTALGTRNRIYGNRITGNGPMAIEHGAAGAVVGNEGMPKPVFTGVTSSANQLVLEGTSDNDGDYIEIFLSDGPESALALAGAAIQAGGVWTVTLPHGAAYQAGTEQQWLGTATGRTALENTSELSGPVFSGADPVCKVFLPETIQVCAGESVPLGAGLRCGAQCAEPDPTPVDCNQGCTHTAVGGSNLNVNAGEVFCTPEGTTYDGHASINGGTWRVCGEADPQSFAFNQGSLEVAGWFEVPGVVHAGENTSILVTGGMEMYELHVRGSLVVQGDTRVRYLWVERAGTVLNEGYLDVRYGFNEGSIHNVGRMHADKGTGTSLHGAGFFENGCLLHTDSFLLTYATFINDGFITSNDSVQLRGGSVVLREGSSVEGRRLIAGDYPNRNPQIFGTGPECASVTSPASSLYGRMSADGAVDFCDPNGFDRNDASLSSSVTTDCSCDVPSVREPVFQWSPAIGLDDPSAEVPVASPTSTTTYSLLAQGIDGDLLASESVTVEVVSCP